MVGSGTIKRVPSNPLLPILWLGVMSVLLYMISTSMHSVLHAVRLMKESIWP